MAFQKVIIVMSGGGNTGLVKLSGSFDGLNKVKCECRCPLTGTESKLYIIADEVTEITVESSDKTFEVPIAAKSDIACLLSTGGRTLTGSSGGRADRRQLEGRIDLYKRERNKQLKEKKDAELRAREKERKEREAAKEAAYAEEKAARHDDDISGKEQIAQAASDRCNTETASQRDMRYDGNNSYARRANAFADTDTAKTADNSYVGSVLQDGITYDGTNFYQAVKPQLDEMFVRYPAEQRLNSIVPNSKWVRIDVDGDDYYVVGILYDLSQPTFICYGIPGVRNVAPPSEIADVSVWLPLDNAHPDGAGFWVIYQSAHNGKCIK